jgi:hypothetical protein
LRGAKEIPTETNSLGSRERTIFKSDSPIRATTTVLVKGLLVEVDLDGRDARAKKDQVIALLKAAAARL